MLTKITKANTDIEFLMLCGHTHGKAHYQPYDNLSVRVGHAEYTALEIQEILSL